MKHFNQIHVPVTCTIITITRMYAIMSLTVCETQIAIADITRDGQPPKMQHSTVITTDIVK